MVSEDERFELRVKFTKKGGLKYISHLDLARTVRSAFLRARLPVWYTLGFNPHPKFNFSLPLSVGTSSECEFMDIMLTEKLDGSKVTEMLNAAFPPDLRVTDAYYPTTKFSQIGWAEYELDIISPYASDELAGRILDALDGDINIVKKSKSGMKPMNIAPYVRNASCTFADGKLIFRVLLSCGENTFVNPKYLIDHLEEALPTEFADADYTTCRTQVYYDDGVTVFT